MSKFDVVGVGLNATDTLLLVPKFPAYAGKEPFVEEMFSPGGQVASAMVACAKLGLRVKYIGTMGDDERGRIQWDSLLGTGINLDDVQVRKIAPTNPPTSSSINPPGNAPSSGAVLMACASNPKRSVPK